MIEIQMLSFTFGLHFSGQERENMLVSTFELLYFQKSHSTITLQVKFSLLQTLIFLPPIVILPHPESLLCHNHVLCNKDEKVHAIPYSP